MLKAAIGGVAGLALGAPVLRLHGAQSTSEAAGTIKLADDLFILRLAGEANVVAHTGADGVLLVDGGSAAGSDALMKAASSLPRSGRIHTLFNTHWHPEQTGSNERLGKAGARIIAHENTKLWLGYSNPVPLQDKTWGPLPPKALPNATTYDQGSIEFGGEQIEYGYLLQA